jgi:uncharacterized protein YraI
MAARKTNHYGGTFMFNTSRNVLRWLAPALAIVLCLSFSTPGSALSQETGESAWTAITTSDLNIRSGPSASDPVITVMPYGTTVTVTGAGQSGFLPVSWDGISGWSSADYLTESAPADSGTASETGTAQAVSFLNFRTGPGTGYGIISVIPDGATVTLTGQSSDGFVSVAYEGYDGWVSADYVTTGTSASAPAPEPDAPAVSSMVTTSSLNMRSDADLSATVITVLPAGAEVSVTGAGQNGFLPVSYDGHSGWASADFLQGGSAPAPSPAPETGGSGISWPVRGGTWSIIQGYNGGTHQNRSDSAQYYYALDIARTDGDTAGQSVYAPASGTILWLDPGSGGIAIDMGNGYTVAMFHSTFDGGLSRGQWVDQGQYLGTVSGPGGAGYASTPHVDITLWQTSGGGRAAAPFSGGNAISGMSFDDVGGSNQHGGTTFNP